MKEQVERKNDITLKSAETTLLARTKTIEEGLERKIDKRNLKEDWE